MQPIKEIKLNIKKHPINPKRGINRETKTKGTNENNGKMTDLNKTPVTLTKQIKYSSERVETVALD